ncbi:hypothetical protein [Hoeflea prorocentri]|uniref:Uncharacterized protein n=1 Tax=Hoeflea prorocentri TaxID=1922333 RepID=A0A9X3UIU2_9HYPH|nr:hypothetical protein [Hoeflea prorocentri]MCY6381215.1 hypothetical protein [Hoeflea prorocentri]MDA5399015.1 hypothetical protein [Hoeflea prorocentri]
MTNRLLFPLCLMLLVVLAGAPTGQVAQAQIVKGIGKALQETGEAIGKGVDKTGEAIEKGVRQTGDALKGDKVPPREVGIVPSYLYVQQAGALEFKDGTLSLTNLAPSTFYFSDRPVREAGHVPHDVFVEMWSDSGEGSFKSDPPNAAIAVAGLETEEPLVVELLTATLNGEGMTFTVNVNSGSIPAEAKDVALFVDLD